MDEKHAEFFVKLRALLKEYDMQIDSESIDFGVRVCSRDRKDRKADYTTYALHEHIQEIAERKLVKIANEEA